MKTLKFTSEMNWPLNVSSIKEDPSFNVNFLLYQCVKVHPNFKILISVHCNFFHKQKKSGKSFQKVVWILYVSSVNLFICLYLAEKPIRKVQLNPILGLSYRLCFSNFLSLSQVVAKTAHGKPQAKNKLFLKSGWKFYQISNCLRKWFECLYVHTTYILFSTCR